jgi:hypothetical protein
LETTPDPFLLSQRQRHRRLASLLRMPEQLADVDRAYMTGGGGGDVKVPEPPLRTRH